MIHRCFHGHQDPDPSRSHLHADRFIHLACHERKLGSTAAVRSNDDRPEVLERQLDWWHTAEHAAWERFIVENMERDSIVALRRGLGPETGTTEIRGERGLVWVR